jgi:hypothetical protein
MADAYVFQAALLCADCAKAVMAQTQPPEGVDPANPDESLYDSSDYPKGPYPDGGGEADCPQHCDQCGVFLNNELTGDGYEYVSDSFTEYMRTGRGNADVLREWKAAYPDSWDAVADFMAEQAEFSDLRRIRYEILTD